MNTEVGVLTCFSKKTGYHYSYYNTEACSEQNFSGFTRSRLFPFEYSFWEIFAIHLKEEHYLE